MAEITALRNNALPYPVYGVPYGVVFPILDNDGDLVGSAAGLDSEISKNGDTPTDCTNEATEIGTSGTYYLVLSAAEMTADVVALVIRTTTTDAKPTVLTLYPRKLVALHTGTAAGGTAGAITLDASAPALDDAFNGCLLVATLDGTPEARIVDDYDGAGKQASVRPDWTTPPDSDDTFTIYLPEGMQLPTVNVTAISHDADAADHLEADYDGTGYSTGGDATAANQAAILSALAAMQGAGFDGSTDSMEQLREAIDLVSELGAGDGSVTVNHDTGGADALAYRTASGAGIDNAVVRAWLKTDYDAGNRSASFVRGLVFTDASGRWTRDMKLDPGTYVIEFSSQGHYGPDTVEVVVD